jgi:hypothetical protein
VSRIGGFAVTVRYGPPCARGSDGPCSGTGASHVVCTSAKDGAMSRVEVLSGPERRRRWSEEQKRAIVAEAFAPGASVSAVYPSGKGRLAEHPGV